MYKKAWFRHPASAECWKTVHKLTTDYWSLYTRQDGNVEGCDTRVLPYPIAVDPSDGRVVPLEPPYNEFPDVGGSVVGKSSGIIPSKVTT